MSGICRFSMISYVDKSSTLIFVSSIILSQFNSGLNDFFVLRSLEIVTSIRNSDYRPSCSCSFAPLIESLRCLQAVAYAFYG